MARARRRGRFVGLDHAAAARPRECIERAAANPEDEAGNRELRAVLDEAIDALPESHRTVFVLRELEGLDTAQTAECLEISPESVRVRLHRARALLRREVDRRIGAQTRDLYAFHLRRCDRVVEGAFAKIERLYGPFRY
jgi:RNA polymerase sigma-70 factor (ECF subfamily)